MKIFVAGGTGAIGRPLSASDTSGDSGTGEGDRTAHYPGELNYFLKYQ